MCRIRIASWFGVLLMAVGIGWSLAPRPAEAWWNGDWSYRKQISLDSGATGAALPGDTGQIPVLIRLHDGNFKFTDAKDDGSDIRFVAEDDKTPLKYHIEKYDNVFDLGFVWVAVPGLKAGATTKIWMYYGNGKATPADNAAQTYDADQTLIWHFGEHNAPPRDMTAYANNATSPDRTAEGSLIATGAKFDGTTPIALPASASLAIEDGGQLSWSAWLKPDDVSGDQMLYVQRDGANALAIGVTQGVAYASAGAVRLDAPAAFEVGKWHHLTVTAGDALTLYVDGVAVKSAAARLPHLATAPSLGGEAGATSGGFKGELDELEIAKTARSAAFVKALYAGQGPEQALVKYGEDEQNSSWSSGYFGIILRSVTLDGWVIIGILLVMAAISWVVMATKTQYIQQVGRGNQAFLEIYKEVRGDLPALHRFLLDKNDRNNAARRNRAIGSPLARVFSAGIEELHIRVDPEARPGQGLCVLADQSIHAIRASIDAVVVREDQRLNSLLVLLTIAISGGPFIGLLGTVVGVMITFAAIAAAGDVNVNAIAPGIAAALVATVAGLFVAIPALFGYNYLLSRVKEISSDIDVFVDRFITRLAESYRSPDALTDMAAE